MLFEKEGFHAFEKGVDAFKKGVDAFEKRGSCF